MKIQFFCILFFLPNIVWAQEVLNQKGICYGAISGSEIFASQEKSEAVIVQCFDETLAQCAANADFTNCIKTSNEAILDALEYAHTAFDQSTLESALLGKRTTWKDFEESLHKLQEATNAHTDAQMESFRASFFAAMKINELR